MSSSADRLDSATPASADISEAREICRVALQDSSSDCPLKYKCEYLAFEERGQVSGGA
jgi:hypothetical protein